MGAEITTERGVVIRNLTQVQDKLYPRGSYTFQAQVDGQWYECGSPCGDWTPILRKVGEKVNKLFNPFSVSVGWWELDDIYYKRGRYAESGRE